MMTVFYQNVLTGVMCENQGRLLILLVPAFKGTHMVNFCTKSQKTVCQTCPEGYFAHLHHIFDRCEKCQTCQSKFLREAEETFKRQTLLVFKFSGFNSCLSTDYDRKCTPTTDATCTCAAGFLCSNSICSACVEDKCVTGERPKQTGRHGHSELSQFYHKADLRAALILHEWVK